MINEIKFNSFNNYITNARKILHYMAKKGFIILLFISALIVLSAEKINNYSLLLFLAFAAIIFFNIKSLAENDLNKYIFYGFLVQAGYVILDVSISGLAGKSAYFGFVQLANFLLAGLLLLVSVKGKDFKSIKFNNYLLAGILISCLALAGVPGLNLFVGEYFLYTFAYNIHPLLLCACFVCSLLTLLTYLKLVSYACAGAHHEAPGSLLKAGIIILCLTCIILGVFPWIQTGLIEAII